jgi:hypothetical protein
VRPAARRAEQRAGASGRDELEATEGLSRSRSAAVVTPSVSQANDAEHRITFTPCEEACLRRWQRKEEPGAWRRGPARRVGSGTTRNEVEGRQPNDRRETGVLSQNTVTGRVRQFRRQPIVGSIGTCQCVSRSLRSGGNLFASSASTIRRWSAVHRDGSVCPFWRALRSGGRHSQCKCVDHTLQLDDARRERLRPGAARYVCRWSGLHGSEVAAQRPTV